MEFLATPEAGLLGLFLASFLAATLLPGGSEAVLFALLRLHPEQAVVALILATLGNTLGGMTTYGMARLLPEKRLPQKSAVVARHGAPVLILAWAPIVGDALCAAAGWLRLPWLPCALWMALGKGLRYAFVAAGAAW
ncbi:MAG: DedA family protein [Rhodocyclales bacterium]|nr:DedA family protein [Rhodocyclales bacterium]